MSISNSSKRISRRSARRLESLVGSLAVLVLGAGTVACGSVGSDGPSGSGFVGHEIGLDESCGSGGFTPRAVLEDLAPTYEAPLYRLQSEEGGSIQLRTVYAGGSAECDRASSENASSAAKLSIEVRVEVESGDGALHETFPAVLSGYVHSDEFRVVGAIAADDVEGALAPDSPTRADGHLIMEGWLGLESRQFEGALRSVRGPTEGGVEGPTVGVWNRGRYVVTDARRPCGGRSGLTRRALRKRLGESRRGQLVYTGRRPDTDLEVRLASSDAPVACEPTGSRSGHAQLSTEVRIEVTTADGSLDDALTGKARLTPDGELDFFADRDVADLEGSLDPPESVPAGTVLEVRGTFSGERRDARGTIRLETPGGHNALGVPNLGSWRGKD